MRTVLFIGLFVFVIPLASFAAIIPFGGVITSSQIPCIGAGAYAVEVKGFVRGIPTSFLLMYQAGFSRFFLFGPPKNPKQFVLGSAIPASCNGAPAFLIDALPGQGSSKL